LRAKLWSLDAPAGVESAGTVRSGVDVSVMAEPPAMRMATR
jgi:hypothetical protein